MGARLTSLGLIIVALGLFGLNSTTMMCPASGCSQVEIWEVYALYYALLWSGSALAAGGLAMVVLSIFMSGPPDPLPRTQRLLKGRTMSRMRLEKLVPPLGEAVHEVDQATRRRAPLRDCL